MAGHVAPEAPHGGPIAAVREGDVIKFDIEARRLDVELTDEEIKTRIAEWKGAVARIHERGHGEVRLLRVVRVVGRGYELTNSSTSSLKRSGRSTIGTCPVSSKITFREPGINRSYCRRPRPERSRRSAPR